MSGHTGPLFKPALLTSRVGKGWVSPMGEIFSIGPNGFWPGPEDTFIQYHEGAAEKLVAKFYPGLEIALWHCCPELLQRGWVRAYADGYYEVWSFERSKRVLLDLVSALKPESNVTIDILDGGVKVIEMPVVSFLDKYQ